MTAKLLPWWSDWTSLMSTVVRLFAYMTVALIVATTLILVLDSLAYGALLANARAVTQLRRKLPINEAGSATVNTGVDAQAGAAVASDSAASLTGDASATSTLTDREYSRWLTRWTDVRGYIRTLEDQARACQLPAPLASSDGGSIADPTGVNPKRGASDDVLDRIANAVPSFAVCAWGKTVGRGLPDM